MQFVELGQEVQLTATIPKRFTNYQNATLHLRLDHGRTIDMLLNTRVQLTDGAGAHRWRAAGLTAKELSATVDVTWTGQGMLSNKIVRQQVFVYRSQVELLAVDDENAPIAGAAYEATMRVHPEYTGPIGQVQLSGQTNGQGKATISNLPPLESVEIRWKNPNLLSDRGWVTAADFTPDGAQRKAILRGGYRAQLVGVAANDSLTRYVNVPLDGEDANAGPLVTIRAKVHAEDGGGRAGDRIWARVKWGDGNCTRTDKAPKLEGQSLVEIAGRNQTEYVVEKQLGADRGEVVFTLDCGVAGGDSFSLWVGGDSHAEDDGPVLIKAKRKLRLEPYFPPDYPNADRLFCDDFKGKLTRALAAAEIELEIAGPQTITWEDGQDDHRPKRVSAEVAEQLGWAPAIHYVYTHDELYRPIARSFSEPAVYPTVRAFYADSMIRISQHGQPFKVEGMTTRTSEWITSGSRSTGFLPCDLDGGSMLTVFRPAKPEEPIYEYVYLWDHDSEDHYVDNHREEIGTHAWAVDQTTIAQENDHYTREEYPVHKGRLLPLLEAQQSGLTVIPLNQSGLPEGYVYHENRYAQRTLIRTEPAVDELWGEWRTADGNHGRITMEHIEIDMDESNKCMRFRFKLPDEAQPGPGNLATATVGLKTASGGIAGRASGCANILLHRGGEPSDKAAQALLHELGHSLGQSWADNGSPPAGVRFDRKYLYGNSITGSAGNRGHQGPHCAFGLADEYLDDAQDYGNLLESNGIHGSCVMYGGIGRQTVYSDQTRKFCQNCLPTIKSQDLSRINGGRA
ncbi:MAG: hypothetical protein R6X02_21715 [Enhygromyxa sp.]